MRINMPNIPNRFVPNWSAVLSVTLILSNTFSAVVADDYYTFNQVGQELNGDSAYDYAGWSVALSNSGKTVAVGAYLDDGVNGTNSGSAKLYKYDLEDDAWIQLGQDLDGEYYNDHAGYDVDISASGEIVAVGAILNDGEAWSGGHVRVYQYDENENTWDQLGGDLDGEDAWRYFGYSLALSADGKTVASSGSSYVQVHRYDGAAWNILGAEIPRWSWGYLNSMLSLSPDGRVIAIGEYGLNRVRVLEYEEGTGWTQMGPTITGSGSFGWAVSLSSDGTSLVVGAPNDLSRGSVSVFHYNGGTWSALGSKLIGNKYSERFGYAVEISSEGDRIGVGGTHTCNTYAGRIALFEYDGDGSWVQLGDNIYGEDPYDHSGWAVALSGDGQVIAHGTRYNDDNGYLSGHVRVFESITSTYISVAEGHILHQLGEDIDGERYGDYSGISLGLSTNGKTVAIGAHQNDGVNGTNSGHARVYKFDDGSWEQMGQDLDGEYYHDWAGYDVDISASGEIVAVGAIYNDGGAPQGGHVRVYQFNSIGNLWEQLGGDLDGDEWYRYFGYSLSLSADGLVLASAGTTYVQVHKYDAGTGWTMLGQELNRYGGSSRSMLSLSSDGSVLALGEYSYRRVRMFKYQVGTGSWAPMGSTIHGAHYYFGYAVSLSSDGTILGVGNFRQTSGHGIVHVFEYNGSTWNLLGSPLHGNQYWDFFGYDLDMSSDGQRIAVGALYHDDCYWNIGKAALYEYDGDGSWVQVGRDAIGEAQNDYFGYSVAISGDGESFASGSIHNDGNGYNSGHVRVYGSKELTPGASGDPHFKTWVGESYDFHGLCDLVLLKNEGFKSGLGMDIHIRTKKMMQWSYISNAVLRIGEDILEIVGEGNGKTVSYWINGVAGNEGELSNGALLSKSISGYPIFYRRISTKQHEFTVDLGDSEKIVVKTWKDLVRVDIHGATESNFGESLGLMGTFSKGLHMGRDRMTVLTDFNDFGQEWQVLPSEPTLFHSREGPQAPEKCPIPTSTKLRRRLSENIISQEQAVIACARLHEADRDMCIFDIMATNDMEISGAY